MASPAVLSAASRLAACACAASPIALRASMKRPLSAAAASAAAVADSASASAAAAAVAAGFPTNVTLAAPSRSGPLDLPPGAPVWKRKPGAPDQLLYERTPREMLKNLLYLAQSPHGPMRPEALHRLLQRVGSAADFELAVKGLNVARNSRVTFTEQTATLFAAAAVRCGQPRVALEMFAKHKTTGLKPQQTSFVPLVEAAGLAGDAELLRAIASTLWAAGVEGAPSNLRLAQELVLAHVRCGGLESAVRLYNKVKRLSPSDEQGWGTEYRPAVAILAAATKAARGEAYAVAAPASAPAAAPAEGAKKGAAAAAPAPLHPALAATIRRTVLADATPGSGATKRYAFMRPGGAVAAGKDAGDMVPRRSVAAAAAAADAALPPLPAPGSEAPAAAAAAAPAPAAAPADAPPADAKA